MTIGAEYGVELPKLCPGKVRFVLQQVGLEKEKKNGFLYNQNYK